MGGIKEIIFSRWEFKSLTELGVLDWSVAIVLLIIGVLIIGGIIHSFKVKEREIGIAITGIAIMLLTVGISTTNNYLNSFPEEMTNILVNEINEGILLIDKEISFNENIEGIKGILEERIEGVKDISYLSEKVNESEGILTINYGVKYPMFNITQVAKFDVKEENNPIQFKFKKDS